MPTYPSRSWLVVISVLLAVAILLWSRLGSGGEAAAPAPKDSNRVEAPKPGLSDASAPVQFLREASPSVHSEASAKASERDGVAMEVLVLGPDRVPKKGAQIRLRDPRSGQLLGSGATAGDGVATLSVVPPRASVVLSVQAEDAARYRADLAAQLPAKYVVELAPSARLEGAVVLYDGRSAPEGTEVCAWRALSMTPERFKAMRGQGEEVLSTRVDRYGNFVLEGVESDRDYTLVAGGSSWCMAERVRHRAEPGKRVTLRLLGLFACVLDLTLPDCSRPPESSGWTIRRGEPDIPGLCTMSGSGIEVAMAGMDIPEDMRVGVSRDWRRQPMIYAAELDQETIHGFSCRVEAPGFSADDTQFRLERWHGTWCRSVCFVRMNARGLGQVDLHMGSRLRDVAATADHDLRMVVKPLGFEVAYTIPLLRTENVVPIPGLPYGAYDVRLESNFDWAWPDKGWHRLVVGEAPVRLVVPEDEFGGLVVAIGNPDATRRGSLLQVSHRRLTGGDEHTVHLTGDPYVMYGLLPGEHALSMNTMGPSPERIDLGHVTIRAGEVTRMVAYWPKP